MSLDHKPDKAGAEKLREEFQILMESPIPLGKLKGQKLEVLIKDSSHQRYTEWILDEMPASALAKNILRARMLWGLADRKQRAISAFLIPKGSSGSPPFKSKRRTPSSVLEEEEGSVVLTQPLVCRGASSPRKRQRVESPGGGGGPLAFSHEGVAELEQKLKAVLPEDTFKALLLDRDRFLETTCVSDAADSTKTLVSVVYLTLPVQNSTIWKTQFLKDFDSFQTEGLKKSLTSLWGWTQSK